MGFFYICSSASGILDYIQAFHNFPDFPELPLKLFYSFVL